MNDLRKLASVRVINELRPIPGADNIETAVVDGWSVVVKKGEFATGDKAIYFEIDSWVPNNIAPFLTKESKTPKVFDGVIGERLRTVKLRGQISQGLLLPLSDDLPEGTDLTEQLGVVKYDPPIPLALSGIARGNFPSSFPKTDEERIQNLSSKWSELSTLTYEVTEKLDGSSMSCGILDGEFIVCSRNINLVESEDNAMWSLARRLEIEPELRSLELEDIILQGEIIGPKIQGNYYGLSEYRYYIFSVYDVKAKRYFLPKERKILVAELGLKHVPVIVEELSLSSFSISCILEYAEGISQISPVKREGLVFKSLDGTTHWKTVSNEFLLRRHD